MQATITIDNRGQISTRFSRPMNPLMDYAMFSAVSRIQSAVLRAARSLGLTPVMDNIRTLARPDGLGGYDLWFRPRDGRAQLDTGRMDLRLDSRSLPGIGVDCLPAVSPAERSLRALALQNLGPLDGASTGPQLSPQMLAEELGLRQSPRHSLVYLAGPYSAPAGMAPDAARAMQAGRALHHAQAAAWLKGLGFSVLSPVAMGHAVVSSLAGASLPVEFSGWRHECLVLLSMSDAVLVLDLPGLNESRGVDAELGHAARLGLPVRLLTPLTHGHRYQLQDIDVAGWALRRGQQ